MALESVLSATMRPSLSKILVLTSRVSPSAAPSTLVEILTPASSADTFGVVMNTPHTGMWTGFVSISLTFLYSPAPGYHLDEKGLFSSRTTISLRPCLRAPVMSKLNEL